MIWFGATVKPDNLSVQHGCVPCTLNHHKSDRRVIPRQAAQSINGRIFQSCLSLSPPLGEPVSLYVWFDRSSNTAWVVDRSDSHCYQISSKEKPVDKHNHENNSACDNPSCNPSVFDDCLLLSLRGVKQPK
jgi:hypothetical protein